MSCVVEKEKSTKKRTGKKKKRRVEEVPREFREKQKHRGSAEGATRVDEGGRAGKGRVDAVAGVGGG